MDLSNKKLERSSGSIVRQVSLYPGLNISVYSNGETLFFIDEATNKLSFVVRNNKELLAYGDLGNGAVAGVVWAGNNNQPLI